MPDLSTSIQISKDGQYVLATGIYPPRVKCFDVNNLSLKFERCFDSGVVTFQMLSDDWSKVREQNFKGFLFAFIQNRREFQNSCIFFQLVFLHCDRYLEFHVAHGKHYRLRVPRYGRDMQYHPSSCDLFIVGVGYE